MAALTQAQIQECQYWLAYGGLTQFAIPYIDVGVHLFTDVIGPNLDDFSSDRVVNTIFPALRKIEARVTDQLNRRKAKSVDGGDLVLNERELQDVLETMDYWVQRLEAVLMIKRRRSVGGGSGSTMTVY